MNKIRMRLSPDSVQQLVINATGGYHLVLASPGCGKTQILTWRIKKAHANGVNYDDMLCLTFTNRAARGMLDRIKANIIDTEIANLYVGNVHRFCSKFLFDNAIVPAETSIIDDDDAISIISHYMDEDEYRVKENYNRKKTYAEIVFFSHIMHQIAHNHPKILRLHPDCMNANDIIAMRTICEIQHMTFSAEAVVDIYDHTDLYNDTLCEDTYDYGIKHIITDTLRKMYIAKQYEKYKTDNKLLDYADLLLLTYDILKADTICKYKRYKWIQVDEVQDLNPLQLAIIHEITAKEMLTVMYLGDEQQAIFSFMGAKIDTLTMLKGRCAGNIHHLNVNHRSSKYLLNTFNTYAEKVLHISRELLPSTTNTDDYGGDRLRILASSTVNSEYKDVAAFTAKLYQSFQKDNTAVIVNSNFDADKVSEALNEQSLPHFKVSGDDLFSSPEIKLLLAHFSVIATENNFIAWARLLKGIGVFHTNVAAREFMSNLLERAMLPTDLLAYNGNSTYTQDFADIFSQKELVVFDTETTGLNVFEDDIVQIAAMKIRNGKVVEGSEFNIFMQTNREIPAKLGETDNPIIDEIKHNTIYERCVGLRIFMDYADNNVLIGHNADYDYNILNQNLLRYLPEVNLSEHNPKYFDTLKLIRLLMPDLKGYKLKSLLSELNLQGENSHLADADVLATISLVNFCYVKCAEYTYSQTEFLSRARVKQNVETFVRNYKYLYSHTAQSLYVQDYNIIEPALIGEMKYIYKAFVETSYIKPVLKMDYIYRYLIEDVLITGTEHSLKEQLTAHIVEINTLKEADLCGSTAITDRIFVTTVHKAKGLEFDNVVIFDAVDGRFPNYFSANNPRQKAEDARKFYVAISRAKQRLYVAYSLTRIDYHNQPQPRELTPFMTPILKYFG